MVTEDGGIHANRQYLRMETLQSCMSDAGRPSRRVILEDRTDLVAAFERSLIEFLEVSDRRAVTLLEGAIFLVDIENGTLRDASELTDSMGKSATLAR